MASSRDSNTKRAMTKYDEGETYASTTASPPPIQISLDDSLETDYKESQFMSSGGLISPNTDFSEEGGFFKDVSDEDSGAAPGFGASYGRYRTAPPPPAVSTTTMSGCTWHTVNNQGASSSPQRAVSIALSQQVLPQSPSSGGANPLSALSQQVQMAMMVESGGVGVDGAAAGHMTEVLLSTVSGISTLRSAMGDHVLSELLALLLKDGKGQRTAHLPLGLLDN